MDMLEGQTVADSLHQLMTLQMLRHGPRTRCKYRYSVPY